MGYFPSVTPILSTQQECTFYQIAPLAGTPSMWLPEGRDLPGLPTAVNKELGDKLMLPARKQDLGTTVVDTWSQLI